MKKFNPLLSLLLLGLLALAAPAFAAGGTDLELDSLHQGMQATPFTEGQSAAISPALAQGLQALLSRCVVEVTDQTSGTNTDFGPRVRPECASEIQTAWESNAMSDTAAFTLDGVTYRARTFDGRYSDGGDEFDIAIYNASGARVALMTAIHSEDDVLTGLGRISGVRNFPAGDKTLLISGQ